MPIKTARISIPHDWKHKKRESPEEKDEESVSGSAPEPESDDDTLQNVKDVGMANDVDEEHPGEVDIGREIDKDEKDLWEE